MLLLIDLKNILKLLKKKNHYFGQSSTNYNFYKNKKVQTLMLGPFKLGWMLRVIRLHLLTLKFKLHLYNYLSWHCVEAEYSSRRLYL